MQHDTISRDRRTVLRSSRAHLREDSSLLRHGILDWRSFIGGRRAVEDPVVVEVRDRRGRLKQRRYTHNTVTNGGINQLQAAATFGDYGANFLTGYPQTGSSTAPTATTWTAQTGAGLPTSASGVGNTGLQGHQLLVANGVSGDAFTNPVLGVILSNTATVITVDQWYALPLTGAAGTTPASASAGLILPATTILPWIGLSTYSGSTSGFSTAVVRTADGLFADGTSSGAATELNANGLSRAYVGQGSATAPTYTTGTNKWTYAHTWTYSTSGTETIDTVVLCNTLPAAGSILLLVSQLSSSATVSQSGDQVTVTWQVTV